MSINNQGLVWMPYIPVQTTQTISESGFNPKLKSRYSTKIINSNFYGTMGGTAFYITINEVRKSKIENIFKIKNPTD